jgi:hypothetical protein
MKIMFVKTMSVLAFIGLPALAARAGAELPDCGLFPDMHARFACYDNISRAPKPEPGKTLKPAAEKPKAATAHGRKTIRTY